MGQRLFRATAVRKGQAERLANLVHELVVFLRLARQRTMGQDRLQQGNELGLFLRFEERAGVQRPGLAQQKRLFRLSALEQIRHLFGGGQGCFTEARRERTPGLGGEGPCIRPLALSEHGGGRGDSQARQKWMSGGKRIDPILGRPAGDARIAAWPLGDRQQQRSGVFRAAGSDQVVRDRFVGGVRAQALEHLLVQALGAQPAQLLVHDLRQRLGAQLERSVIAANQKPVIAEVPQVFFEFGVVAGEDRPKIGGARGIVQDRHNLEDPHRWCIEIGEQVEDLARSMCARPVDGSHRVFVGRHRERRQIEAPRDRQKWSRPPATHRVEPLDGRSAKSDAPHEILNQLAAFLDSKRLDPDRLGGTVGSTDRRQRGGAEAGVGPRSVQQIEGRRIVGSVDRQEQGRTDPSAQPIQKRSDPMGAVGMDRLPWGVLARPRIDPRLDTQRLAPTLQGLDGPHPRLFARDLEHPAALRPRGRRHLAQQS